MMPPHALASMGGVGVGAGGGGFLSYLSYGKGPLMRIAG